MDVSSRRARGWHLQHLPGHEMLPFELESCRSVLDPVREVQKDVPEAVGRREFLSRDDLVINFPQRLERPIVLRHSGVRAKTEAYLSGQDLQVRCQEV